MERKLVLGMANGFMIWVYTVFMPAVLQYYAQLFLLCLGLVSILSFLVLTSKKVGKAENLRQWLQQNAYIGGLIAGVCGGAWLGLAFCGQ